MAYHSHNRGNGDFERQQEIHEKRQEAHRLLGVGLEPEEEVIPEIVRVPDVQPEPETVGTKRKRVAKTKGVVIPPNYSIHEVDISELQEDPNNARRHSSRNIGMIEQAIEEVGVARSVVVDEDYFLMAGNGAKEAIQNAGIRKVIVIETDGETLVAVQRKGLTSLQKTRLALFDNRTTDLSEFDPAVLKELVLLDDDEGPGILDGIFTQDEVEGIFLQAEEEANAQPPDGPIFGDNSEASAPSEPIKGKRMAFRMDFDSGQQQAEFNRWLKWLKNEYGPDDSVAGMFIAFLHEHAPESLGIDEERPQED